MPSARLRSAPSANVRDRIASALGAASAAPRPWPARAGGDEHAERAGEPGGQRGEGEQADPGDEHPAVPGQIARAPAEQQEAGDEHAVGDDHPLQVVGAEVQIGLDRGERDVDHGQVDHGHRHDAAHDGED
jgi:hypothetical protein